MTLLLPGYRSRSPALDAGPTSGYVPPPITSGLVLDVRSHLDTYQNTSFTTPAVADTDPIDGWKDQSGNANHLLGTGTTTRPLLKTGQVNGKPSVRFDGSNDKLKALFTLTVFNIFCIIKQISWTSGRNLMSGGTVDNFSLLQLPTASPNIQLWNGSSSSGTNTGLTVGTWFHLEVQFSAASAIFTKVNAVAAVTGSGGGNATHGGINIGNHNNGTAFANVEFAALLVYNTSLSSGDATLVRNYLNSIYAVF
jgi:hypothetical protein